MSRYFFVGVIFLPLVVAGAAHAVDIVPVTVGNPGNAPDTRYETPGYGGVNYVYHIGTFEVTAGHYRDFLNAVDPAGSNSYGLYNSAMDSNEYGCQLTWNAGSSTYDFSGGLDEAPGSTAEDWENRPVNFVSWGDAARFANWLHNGQPTGQLTGDPTQDAGLTEEGSYYLNGATSDAALLAVVREPDATWVIPSEDEWYKAAYHYNDGVSGNYHDYPTSSDIAPGYVDDSGNHSGDGTPFVEGGTDPGNYATYDGDFGAKGIGSPYYRTEVGEWENSDSPYATFDQGGNVFEWNEAVIGSFRGNRGGSLSSFFVADLHAATRDYYAIPTYENGHVGFRVAEVFIGACIFHDGTCQDVTESACNDLGGKWIGPGTFCIEEIPAVSEWGLLVMALLGLVAGTVMFRGRRATA